MIFFPPLGTCRFSTPNVAFLPKFFPILHLFYPFTSPFSLFLSTFFLFFPLLSFFTFSPFVSSSFHIFSPQMTSADISPGGIFSLSLPDFDRCNFFLWTFRNSCLTAIPKVLHEGVRHICGAGRVPTN
jgi:hypothetical protein